MKRREHEQRLREMRWFPVRHGGRHDIWSDGERELAVPRHTEINEYTARALLKEAGGER
jgi:mRNA interferase HicA